MSKYTKLAEYRDILDNYDINYVRPGDIDIMTNPINFKITSLNTNIPISISGSTVTISTFSVLLDGRLTSVTGKALTGTSGKHLYVLADGTLELTTTKTISHSKVYVGVFSGTALSYVSYALIEGFYYDAQGIRPISSSSTLGSSDAMFDQLVANFIVMKDSNTGTLKKVTIVNGAISIANY